MPGSNLRLAAAVGLAAAALAAAPAGAADWPQWRGPGRDGVSPERSGWPEGWPPRRLWRRNVGRGCGSPILAGGKLYVMGWGGVEGRPRGNPAGTDTLYCLDARTGRELWRQSYRCRYQCRHRTGDTGGYGGPSATPAFDARSRCVFTLSIDGDLRCWQAERGGELLWGRNLCDEYGVRRRPDVGEGQRDYGFTGSPLVRGGEVIVEVGGDRGTLMAFDARTGRRTWASQHAGPAGHTGGPALLRVGTIDCLAALTLRELVIVRLDAGRQGRTLATYARRTDYGCNIAAPTPAGGGVLLTSAYNQKSCELVGVSGAGARRRWSSPQHALVSSPVVHVGRVFLVDQAVRCLDLADGKLRWRGGSFGHGSALATGGDGRLIVFGRGRLALLEAGGEEYRELSRVDGLVRGTCYPHVALSEGIVACKDRDGELVVLSVRPPK